MDKTKKTMWLVIGVAVLIFATWLMTFLPILLPWSIDLALICCIFMGAGAITYRTDFLHKLIEKKYRFVVLTIIYLVFATLNQNTNLSMRQFGGQNTLLNIIAYLVVGISGSIIWIYVSHQIERFRIAKVFSKIGRITVMILCTHIMAIYITDIIISLIGFNMANGWIYWGVQASRILLLLVGYLLSAKYLKKNRFLARVL